MGVLGSGWEVVLSNVREDREALFSCFVGMMANKDCVVRDFVYGGPLGRRIGLSAFWLVCGVFCAR